MIWESKFNGQCVLGHLLALEANTNELRKTAEQNFGRNFILNRELYFYKLPIGFRLALSMGDL